MVADLDANNNVVARYVHGPGVDETLWVERSGGRYFYHTDGLGSVTEITDENGDVVNRYYYDAFGNINWKCPLFNEGKPCIPNRYTFTGREWDEETRLYYFRARYYNPEIGRFLQKDPYVIIGNNPYMYVNNNPANFVDPLGLITMTNNTPVPVPVKAEEGNMSFNLEPGETAKVDGVYAMDDFEFKDQSSDGNVRKFSDYGEASVELNPDTGELEFKGDVRASDAAGVVNAYTRGDGAEDVPGWKDKEWSDEKGWVEPPEFGERVCIIK